MQVLDDFAPLGTQASKRLHLNRLKEISTSSVYLKLSRRESLIESGGTSTTKR